MPETTYQQPAPFARSVFSLPRFILSLQHLCLISISNPWGQRSGALFLSRPAVRLVGSAPTCVLR